MYLISGDIVHQLWQRQCLMSWSLYEYYKNMVFRNVSLTKLSGRAAFKNSNRDWTHLTRVSQILMSANYPPSPPPPKQKRKKKRKPILFLTWCDKHIVPIVQGKAKLKMEYRFRPFSEFCYTTGHTSFKEYVIFPSLSIYIILVFSKKKFLIHTSK